MKRYLILENGKIFEGTAFGAEGELVSGELCLTTAVGGYTETVFDAAARGQIVVFTFPFMGNYGVCEDDISGSAQAAGVVCREVCETPSNFRCDVDIDTLFKEYGVMGICGVDTRELASILREEGSMRAVLADAVPENTDFCVSCKNPYMAGEEEVFEDFCVIDELFGDIIKINGSLSVLSAQTKHGDMHHLHAEIFANPQVFYAGSDEIRHFAVEGAKAAVAVINLGSAVNAVTELVSRGVSADVYPAWAADRIDKSRYAGIIISDGAEDTEDLPMILDKIKAVTEGMRIFAYGFGHIAYGVSKGGVLEKLHLGHRGANIPVRDVNGTRTYVTSQYHGYAIKDVPGAEVIFENINDASVEGVKYADGSFTVQFKPQYCASPNDMSFLFEAFIKSIKEGK